LHQAECVTIQKDIAPTRQGFIKMAF